MRITSNIVKWFCFTVVFAFLPLITMLVVSGVFDYQGSASQKYVAEILFACIVISADTLRSLIDHRLLRSDILRYLLILVNFLAIIFSAVLYGCMLLGYAVVLHSAQIIPIILLSASLISGLGVQILKREIE